MWAGCDRQTWRKRSSPIMPPRRTVHAAQWMIVCVRVCVSACYCVRVSVHVDVCVNAYVLVCTCVCMFVHLYT
jgi:hypothetical protein